LAAIKNPKIVIVPF